MEKYINSRRKKYIRNQEGKNILFFLKKRRKRWRQEKNIFTRDRDSLYTAPTVGDVIYVYIRQEREKQRERVEV